MIIFENVDLLIIVIIVLVAAIISTTISVISYGRYSTLLKKYNLFMTGKDAESLEEFFLDIQENLDKMSDTNKKNNDIIKILNRTVKKSFQKAGIYKYDAFEEKTGRRSFALALLDYTDTGFVITFQSAENNTQVFVKDVEAGATNVKLGPEEEMALKIALGEK